MRLLRLLRLCQSRDQDFTFYFLNLSFEVTQNIFRLHKGSLDSSLDGLSDDIYIPNLVISLQISYPSSISLQIL